MEKREIIYFINSQAPLYTDPTYLWEETIKAFKALGIKAYLMPHHLTSQAI